MSDKLDQIRHLFQDERLAEAYKIIETLNDSEATIDEIDIIKQDMNLANECLSYLADLESWDLVKQTEDIATFSKGSDTEFIIRSEMLINAPMLNILALFSEVQLLKTWVKILDDATCLATPSKFRRIIQYKFNLPWPANNMDLVVSAVGIPIPDNNSVLIILRSLDTVPSFLGLPIPRPEGNRLTLTIGCLNLTYLGDCQTQVSLIAKSNPHMSIIPVQLINYATKFGVYYFMQGVKSKALEFEGSEFERLMKSNPGYYQDLKDRIDRLNNSFT